MRRIGPERLAALGRGFALLGSGGGGATTMLELMIADSPDWPLQLYEVDELAPETPCVAAAFAGSTYLLTERIPAAEVFEPLVAAATRWTGVAASAVCALEGAGLNGLTPLLLAGTHTVVDADFMGRALPRLDQLSLLVDAVPGVIAVCDTGRGVAVVETARAADVEALVRSSVVQAGGAGAVLVAGFTVGDLREHAVTGTYSRALELGATAADPAQPLGALAAALGGRLLGSGRVTAIDPAPGDPYASAVELAGDDGAVLRAVARSELLAFVRDGRTVAASPEIIVAVDTISRDVLQVDAITLARHVAVLALPAPTWWLGSAHRLEQVTPAAFGLAGLELTT